MKSVYTNIAMFILLFSAFNNYAQKGSNLNSMTGLVEESVSKISQLFPGENPSIFLEFSSPADFEIFKSNLIGIFVKENFTVTTDKQTADVIVNYTLSNAGVRYNETFRDGLFGDYLVEREVSLNSSFNIERDGKIFQSNNVNSSKIDTVKYDEIKILENQSLPFTKGEIPTEPFFSSIIEPLIAVGTAVVTVILFFTVRSK